jgi:glycosyltransferase involved in cell wall biosynthesis
MKQERSPLNKVAGVIAISPTIKRLLHANGVHRDIFVSPQPIDDSFITKEREDKNFLFFQSAAEPFKGAHLAIEALENTSYKLTIAGKIRDNQTLPKSDNVTILNDIPHEQMKEFDRTCSLFLFPALWEEAFGRGWAEAACTGAPIIAFNRGAPNDYLTQKENAYIIEPEQLKETLTFLINNPEERARIGGNAQEYAKTNLIASIVVPKLLQYYTHVLTSTTSSSQFEEQHYPSHLKT